MGWRIPDWEQFEPDKRSDRNHEGPLKWWKCPTSQNRRYKQLISGSRGRQTLAIWYGIVASWARQSEESRVDGVLRTTLAGHRPAMLSELAKDILVPTKTLSLAIANLLQLGWLAEIHTNGTTTGIQNDNHLAAEIRLDKTRLDKKRIDTICHQYDLSEAKTQAIHRLVGVFNKWNPPNAALGFFCKYIAPLDDDRAVRAIEYVCENKEYNSPKNKDLTKFLVDTRRP